MLLVDDHQIVRNGLRSLLDEMSDVIVVGEASNGEEALRKVDELVPDIMMIDIAMPIMNGLEAAGLARERQPNTKSLILSMHNNEDYILKAVEMGAFGYLLKDTSEEELHGALQTIARGEKYFNSAVSNIIINGYLQKKTGAAKPKHKESISIKEKQVLRHIVDGLSSREIADKLSLSIRTIDNHRANMMKKLQVKNAAELVKLALEKNLVD